MTDDSYPPEWSLEPPHPADPRAGELLQHHRPTPAQRALVAELVQGYVCRDHEFGGMFAAFAADRYEELDWAQAFMALLEQFAVTAIGAQGEDLTIRRAQGDAEAAQRDIIEFGGQS